MSFSSLEPVLQEILQVIRPLREDWEARVRVINELQNVVQSVESLRGATIEPFGSFISNLFTRWGDLDISIELFSGSCVLSAGKKRKQSLLEDLLKALRQRGGWNRLQFIPHARVPILKIESSIQRISCDISIDNLEGQLKSKLLFWINDIDGRFRDMVLLVKEWAKAHNINNPKAGTFNSYSLSLLVIFHFQTCEPAIFPPLREIYPRNAIEDLTGTRATAEANIAQICAASIARFKSDKSRAVNRSSLSELFVSFLAKFSDISLKAQELSICPFTGRWEQINSNMRWLPKTYSLFIEDPFEQPENTARSVSGRQLERISQIFEMCRSCLNSERNQSALLPLLTRPHVSRFVERAINIPSYSNGGHSKIGNPQVHKPSQCQPWLQNPRQGHKRPQKQHQFPNAKPQMRNEVRNGNPAHSLAGKHQFHNIRQEGSKNDLNSQRPWPKHQSQGQQMWRPKSEK